MFLAVSICKVYSTHLKHSREKECMEEQWRVFISRRNKQDQIQVPMPLLSIKLLQTIHTHALTNHTISEQTA